MNLAQPFCGIVSKSSLGGFFFGGDGFLGLGGGFFLFVGFLGFGVGGGFTGLGLDVGGGFMVEGMTVVGLPLVLVIVVVFAMTVDAFGETLVTVVLTEVCSPSNVTTFNVVITLV